MTDALNTDLEPDCYRKNNLEWKKYLDSYNRVSATKLKRGIQPLPLSLFLKLFGPQKVLNTYVISRRHVEEFNSEGLNTLRDINMKNLDKSKDDLTMTKTVDFPGVGLQANSVEDGNKVGSQVLKRDALPTRPIFQRNLRVPGRYFPKPATLETELALSLSINDNSDLKENEKQQTIRNGTGHKSGYTKKKRRAVSRIVRGPNCKPPPETLAVYPRRSPTWSNMSTSPAKSLPSLCTNGLSPLKKVDISVENLTNEDHLPMNFRSDERPNTVGGGALYDENGEPVGDVGASIQRCNHRQVSFPRSGTEFITVLHGRPKTLHPRELGGSIDTLEKEGRSKTHVGFVTDG